MKNVRLALLPIGKSKFKVIAWGDNNLWGVEKCILTLNGQPRKGWGRGDALIFAQQLTDEQIVNLTEHMQGSYVSDSRKETLELIDRSRPIPTAAKVESAPLAKPVSLDGAVKLVASAADLVAARREAMRSISRIDRELNKILGPEMALVISEGMGRPLNGHQGTP